MALTKIVSGMEKGPEAIQANFDGITATTDWTTTGISYLNGATGGDGDMIRYRSTQIGARTLYEMTGYLGVNLAASQSLDVLKIPTNIAANLQSYQGRATPDADAGEFVRMDVGTDGTVKLLASSLDEHLTGGFFIDFLGIV